MIISHKHKFIFIKTEKTAGTSLEIALSEICGAEDIITPISPEDQLTRKNLGFIGPQNYLIPFRKYTFKNWLKLIFYWKREKFYNHISATEIKKYICPEIWNTYFKFCFERNPWDKSISWYFWYNRNGHFQNISEFIESGVVGEIKGYNLYTIDDHVVVDKLFKYENIKGSLKEISVKLKLNEELQMPIIKAKGNVRKNRTHYKEFLSEKDKNSITKIFAKEIILNNYEY